MAKIFCDNDVDMKGLNGRTIGIVGYGNQGRAQALNIRDRPNMKRLWQQAIKHPLAKAEAKLETLRKIIAQSLREQD